jgi:hypothetical protein
VARFWVDGRMKFNVWPVRKRNLHRTLFVPLLFSTARQRPVFDRYCHPFYALSC